MISELNGRLISKSKQTVTMMVGDIGFDVNVTSTLLDTLQTGQKVHLYTRLIVRDDGWQIYGFKNPEDRALFDMLLTVHGIGPKTAIGILSSLPVMEFYRAVLSKDEKALTRLPGIGKKTAGRIVVELRDKIGLPKDKLDVIFERVDWMSEATEALLALGYSRQETQEALFRAGKNVAGKDLESLLREALKYLARF